MNINHLKKRIKITCKNKMNESCVKKYQELNVTSEYEWIVKKSKKLSVKIKWINRVKKSWNVQNPYVQK